MDTEEVASRLPRDLLDGIDRFTAEETDKPGRAEAVRRIIRDWLMGHGYLPVEDEPLPEDGMQRQGLIEMRPPAKR